MLIKIPSEKIAYCNPSNIEEIDLIIQVVGKHLRGDAYTEFLDSCLEGIQSLLDLDTWNPMEHVVQPNYKESPFSSYAILTDPFQQYEKESVRTTRCSAGTFGASRRVVSEINSLRDK